MAATASGEPRKCQLTLQAVHLKWAAIMQERRSKIDEWEITNPFFEDYLTSAAQGLLLTEALLVSLTLSQVLSYDPGCKLYEKKN